MSIMNEHFCSYATTRGEVLVAYLYDDIAADERADFDRHLLSCALCRAELHALSDVRTELAQWTPPERAGQIAFERPNAAASKPNRWATWSTIPAWMQVAAAVLFLGAAAGLANLEIRYAPDGLSVTTGWRHVDVARAAKQPQTIAVTGAPSQVDLNVLEQKLRHEIELRAASSSTPAVANDNTALLKRVRALLEESEQRQQRELALRLAEVVRDTQVQRQADLVKIDRSLGLLQNQTSQEVMRTRREVISLAQQVSQQR